MGLMGVLDMGRTALAAQKTAIEVTGENIANVNTPGYSRQTALLETAYVAPNQQPATGSGVVVASIRRAYDQFLQSRLNTQNSANSQQSTEQSALQQIEPLFGDLTTDGLGKSLQDFFGAWQDLAMNPQGGAQRQAVLADAQALADNFHQVGDSLNQVKLNANQSLTGITSDINDKLSQIAALNGQIRTAQAAGGTTNKLLDSRDQLLQGLAQDVGINCLAQSDGTVSVMLAGGPQLVGGSKAATFSLQSNPANGGLFSVMLTQPGESSGSDVTTLTAGADGSSGTLGGALQVRDSLVNGFLNDLDTLAGTLATQVNGMHAAGFGLNGSTGVNFFTPPPASVAGFSSAIGVAVTSTDDIAAASTDPTQPGNGTGNNVNALGIAGLENTPLPMAGGSSTLTGFYSSLVGKVGLAVQTTNQNMTQGTAMLNQLNSLRDSVSGVSMDEELTNLVTYQKAFQGAAQLVTTGEQMLDTVLNMIK